MVDNRWPPSALGVTLETQVLKNYFELDSLSEQVK